MREVVVQADEDQRAMERDLGDDVWRPILASYGITDPTRQDAIIVVVNHTCAAIAIGEGRRLTNPFNVANQVFLSVLLGIRLARKGLV